jgi:hypothetical protein
MPDKKSSTDVAIQICQALDGLPLDQGILAMAQVLAPMFAQHAVSDVAAQKAVDLFTDNLATIVLDLRHENKQLMVSVAEMRALRKARLQ